MPSRRAYLRWLTAGTAGALAGCNLGGTGDDPDPQTDSDEPTPTVTPTATLSPTPTPTPTPPSLTPTGELVAESPHHDDLFGVSLALDGETALIGVYDQENPEEEATGLAYVFEHSDGEWTQQAGLLNDRPGDERASGTVALDGDTALVFAASKSHKRGSCYVFEHSSGNWRQQTTLIQKSGPATERLSGPVALDGNTALVLGRSDKGVWSGYVFERSGEEWRLQDRFASTDREQNEWNNISVALDGDTALIGASHDTNVNGEDAGTVYVFTRSDGQWGQQAKLLPDDGSRNDWFGNSVALDGNTALIGNSEGSYKGNYSGAAYVFERSGKVWTQQTKIGLADGDEFEEFGSSVALTGDTALIGTPWTPQFQVSCTSAGDPGSAYVFERSDDTWVRKRKLVPTSDPNQQSRLNEFGKQVALTTHTGLVGIPSNCIERREGVYVFSLDG